MKGERPPNISFVEKMCDYLRVSPAQRSELIELYTISRVGEKVYAGRKYIKDMINAWQPYIPGMAAITQLAAK